MMVIVSLTSTAVLSQSLSQCLGDLNGRLSSLSLSSMCTESNVQGKLVNNSNGHTCMCTCTQCMFMFPLYNAHRVLGAKFVSFPLNHCCYMYMVCELSAY